MVGLVVVGCEREREGGVLHPTLTLTLTPIYLGHEIDAQNGNRRGARLSLAHGGVTHDE